MNVTIEDAGPCKKILKFEIPKETVDSEFEKKTLEVCGTVELPGFRKGRAPRRLVEKRFGTQIKEEVRQAVVSDCYQKALDEHKLNPVGNPKVGETKMEIGQPFNFDVAVEVWPNFEVDKYKGLILKKKPVVVTDEDMENALQGMSKRKAQLVVVNNGTVKKEDKIICDYKVEVNKSCIVEDEDVELFLANEVVVANTKIPDLVTTLQDAKSGETRNVSVKLSDDFVKEQYRGKDAEIKFTLKEIKRLSYPTVNEEFAKSIGFESLDDLKTKLSRQIEIDKKNWVEEDLRNQVFDILLEQVKFELPQELVNYHTEKRAYRHQLDLLKRGLPLEEIQKRTSEIKNASADSVMRELRASLILDSIAEKEKIFVTENEVEQRISDIARAYNTDTSRVRKQIENQGSLSYLRNEMREGKVLSFLLNEAKIEEENRTASKPEKKLQNK